MYSIIQKIYEKNNKILKEGLKKVLSGEDVSSLTVAIKEFTDVIGKELFAEIAKQLYHSCRIMSNYLYRPLV